MISIPLHLLCHELSVSPGPTRSGKLNRGLTIKVVACKLLGGSTWRGHDEEKGIRHERDWGRRG